MSAIEDIDAYKQHVPAGERAWFLRLTGQTRDPNRMAMIRAMAKKIQMSEKEPHQIFRITVEPEDNNEYDDNAVRVNVLMKDKRTKEWVRHQLGYLNRTYKGEKVLNQKAVRSFIQKKAAIPTIHPNKSGAPVECFKSKLVHFKYEVEGDEEMAVMIVAFHTRYDCQSLPRGCAPIENWGVVPEQKPVGAHAGAAPTVERTDYPTIQQMDLLITLQRKFESLFQLIEIYKEEGEIKKTYCIPPLLSQWHGDPIPFDSERALSNYEAMQDQPVYGDSKQAVDLKVIEKDFGAVMAARFYRIDAPAYQGPVTRLHIQAIIDNLTRALAIFEAFDPVEAVGG